MMHRVYEAACSGGSACLEHESKVVLAAKHASRARVAEDTRSAYISVVAFVGPYCSPSRGSQDSVDSAVIIAGASEPTL